LVLCIRGNGIIHRAHKAIQGDECRPRRMSLLRFPWLSPIRNSFELRGLCSRSYFGPRTCNVIEVAIRVSSSHPYNAGIQDSDGGGRCPRNHLHGPEGDSEEMIDSDQGWYNTGRGGLVYNSPKHRGALDRLPFQGFARRSGIQVFRLYSRPSPVTDRKICGESATHFVRGLEGADQRFIIIFTHLRTRAQWLCSQKNLDAGKVTCYFHYCQWGFHKIPKLCDLIRSLNGTKAFPFHLNVRYSP